jgi:hypothetical protein
MLFLRNWAMTVLNYLVFGDLHGRILPAFKLAAAWSRDHGFAVSGLLQVGDLGYFPDVSRLDKATVRHAQKDPLELGTQLVTEPNTLADEFFFGDEIPAADLWFTVGNHEDFASLHQLQSAAGSKANSFVVDHYCRVHGLRNGAVESLPGPLRVGALWGIDAHAPRARTNTPRDARIQSKAAIALACTSFDVLLTHESPRDAVMPGSGSQEITDIIRSARPAFAFFGHYGGRARQIDGDFGATQVYHLDGLTMRYHGGCAEEGSVGLLTWDGKTGAFEYLPAEWMRTFTRHNWRHR